MDAKAHHAGELVSGLALALLGLYTILQAARWDYLGPDGPGAGFFPLWIGVAMLVLALVLVASSLRRGVATAASASRRGVARALAAWGALVLAVAAFPLIGFVLGFGLLAFFVVAAIHRRPLRVAAVVAVSSAAGFYLVFALALGVALPAGVFGF